MKTETREYTNTENPKTKPVFFTSVQLTLLIQPSVPPVPHLKTTSRWLDVFATEKVQLTCELTDRAEWSSAWFFNGTEIPESDSHLSLSSDKSVLTVTAGSTYSGYYDCQGVHNKKPDSKTQRSNSLKVTVHGKFYMFNHIFYTGKNRNK